MTAVSSVSQDFLVYEPGMGHAQGEREPGVGDLLWRKCEPKAAIGIGADRGFADPGRLDCGSALRGKRSIRIEVPATDFPVSNSTT